MKVTDDLISRTEAIEALFDWELCYTWDEHCKEESESPYIVSPSSVIDKLPSAQPEEFEWCTDCKEYDQDKHCCPRWTKVIRNTVAELKAEQRWIPCSERLPEAGEVVLVYGKRGGIYTAVYNTPETGWRSGWWKLNSKSHNCNPDAWMPLPEPYEVKHER